jgi:hypothetical protein
MMLSLLNWDGNGYPFYALCSFMIILIKDHTDYSEHGEPPRKTVQPQGIWLCLGWVISDSSVGMTLPDKGKGER